MVAECQEEVTRSPTELQCCPILAQDLYGNAVAGRLISALSRMLTYHLQTQGFTCGYDDLLLLPAAERRRAEILDTAETAAVAASARLRGRGCARAAGWRGRRGGGRCRNQAALRHQGATHLHVDAEHSSGALPEGLMHVHMR